MFSKNNIKYIVIIAIGFFLCSSLYFTQEHHLANYADTNFVNIVESLFSSISMASGILLFSFIYKNNENVKIYYTVFVFLSIICMILFFVSKNIYMMGICMCLICFFGFAGFGAGYHFSLISSNVLKEYRGRVFAIGYTLGLIGTYLIILLPEKFYSSYLTLFIYIPFTLICLYMVFKRTSLIEVKNENLTISFKKYFTKISIIVLVMSLLSSLSTDVIFPRIINMSDVYGYTRVYYCLALLIAGFLVDKKSSIFEIITVSSFVFSLLAIVLLKENYSINVIVTLSYSFISFFVLFRTMNFVNLVDNKKGMIWVSAFGLMYYRIMEGIMLFFEDALITHYTTLIIVMSILFAILIILYFTLYYQNNSMKENDSVKKIVIKYKLGVQEENVLNLLIKGLSNQEMADKLFVSVNTIKNHTASIYKKTGMKKKELIDKCF